ncbi:MAG: hypothetical protein ABIS07_04130, partial [Dokdonella sp.]
MNDHRLLAGVLLAFGFFTSFAHAVYVNDKGTGQVLIFPYYTANGGNDTLFSIVNSTADGKALKVRFHEGYDGRSVLDFNVYLPPHGQWDASVSSSQGADSLAMLATGEGACTVPALAPTPGSSNVHSVNFSTATFAGANLISGPTGLSDGGPTTPDRTREGHFDVIEMGTVTNASHGSLTAITPTVGSPADCAHIASAWATGGYWASDATADLSPPSGGLYGTEFIINVAQGTMYATTAIAIDDFSNAPQHTQSGSPAPDLDSASRTAGGKVRALVFANGKALQLDYENPVDAVSALFMTDALDDSFYRSAGIGATSDWIVTAPTKRYYVDPALVSLTAKAPFDRSFVQGYTGAAMSMGGVTTEEWGGSFPFACDDVNATAFDSDGRSYSIGELNDGGPVNGGAGTSSPSLTPCLETSVLTFATHDVDFDGNAFSLPVSALGSSLLDAQDPGEHVSRIYGGVNDLPAAGHLHLDLSHSPSGNDIATRALAPAANGDVLHGLPVVGIL